MHGPEEFYLPEWQDLAIVPSITWLLILIVVNYNLTTTFS